MQTYKTVLYDPFSKQISQVCFKVIIHSNDKFNALKEALRTRNQVIKKTGVIFLILGTYEITENPSARNLQRMNRVFNKMLEIETF